MRQYSYKVRLYPNFSQTEFLAKQLGCCRFVYNYMLELKQNAFKEGNKYAKFGLIKQLTPLKKQENCLFLNDVYSVPLVQSVFC